LGCWEEAAWSRKCSREHRKVHRNGGRKERYRRAWRDHSALGLGAMGQVKVEVRISGPRLSDWSLDVREPEEEEEAEDGVGPDEEANERASRT
jgi:hypothetical protein